MDQANLHLLKALDVLDSALSSGDVKPLLTKSDSFHIYLLHSQLYQSLMLFQISRSQSKKRGMAVGEIK